MPAITTRGYPPIDPFWYGVTFLWIVPPAFSALFDSWSFTTRRWHLLAYALATAFFNSGTSVDVVPRSMHPIPMLVLTLVVYGPVHLALTFVAEGILQWILGCSRTFVEEP